MPANATSNRPTAAVSFSDSPRREQRSPGQGTEFRSALDSIGRGANSDVRQEREQSETQRNKSLANAQAEERMMERREERVARRDEAAEQRREERQSSRRADERAADSKDERDSRRAEGKRSRRVEDAKESRRSQKGEQQAQAEADQQETSIRKEHEIAESSGGGFGSDPPVSEFAEAGGSDRVPLNLINGANGKRDQIPGAASEPKMSERSGKGGAQPSLQPAISNALESAARTMSKAGSAAPQHPGSTEAQGNLASAAAQALSADVDSDVMGQEPLLPGGESAAGGELDPMLAKLERSLGRGASEPMVRTTGGGDSSSSQTHVAGARSVEVGARGLTNNAARAGLDGSQQPSPTADPFNEPEPLPGSVRLRGVRGARINVATEDGQMIRARLDVQDDQVDVRLAAPEGSSQLAEQRVSELRHALSSHGMELGEFDVSTSDGDRSEAESSRERRESSSGDRNSTSPGAEVDPWGRPLGTETTRGSAADGRGALIDLRL